MRCRVAGVAFGLLVGACASPSGPAPGRGGDAASPRLAEGKARLRIVRSDEVLAAPLPAQIRIAGKFVAELGPGEQYRIDLPAGRYAVTATHRPAAPAAPLGMVLEPGRSYRVLVTLDPQRFPAYDGPARPLRFIKESLDAPNDDRRSAFRLQPVREPIQARVQRSVGDAESELDLESGRRNEDAATRR